MKDNSQRASGSFQVVQVQGWVQGPKLGHLAHTWPGTIFSSRHLFVQDHSALTKLLKEPGIFSNPGHRPEHWSEQSHYSL